MILPQRAVASRSEMLRMVSALLGARMGATAISSLWFVIAARELSIGDFADLALLLSLALIFGVFADLGYPLLLSGVVAQDPSIARSACSRVVAKRLPIAVGAAIAFVAAFAVSGTASPVVAMILSLSLIATAVHSSAAATLRGLRSVAFEATNEIGSRLFVLLIGTASLIGGGGLFAAVVVYAAADVLSAGFLILTVLRRTKRCAAADPALFTLRRAMPLAAASILASVYSRIDLWLLAVLGSPTAVAGYAASFRVFEALALPASAVGGASISTLAHLDQRALRRRAAKLLGAASMLALPAAAMVGVAARPVLVGLFGAAYGDQVPVLRVLLLGLLPTLLIGTLGPWVTFERSGGVTAAILGMLVVNVGLNLLFIPPHAGLGAAVATVVTQTFLALVVGALGWAVTKRGDGA
ncbi:MAG: oligosaccharide flippase family protein [Actinomycetota bacterium]|nr:oligosaccharide flippase family protein [Actinomycetota bacterium]